MLKLGVLAPTSRMFPMVGQDYLAGLRGALADADVHCELVIESTGSCAVRDVVLDKIQRLLLQHTPDAVVGIVGAGLSRQVHSLFTDARTPFIINDLGADPLMTGGARNPYVFGISLNLWQSVYALGGWAAAHLGTTACVAAAFHEAGYGIVPAFHAGFLGAGAGTIKATEVTHRATADDDPTEQLQRLVDHNPDFIVGLYSGREGTSFIKAYAALGLMDKLPLIATPLMTHGHWLRNMGDAAAGVRTAFSWNLDAHPEEHARFRRASKVDGDREPAVFALLGYESGLALAGALRRCGEACGRESLREAFAGLEFTSPRGTLRLDPDTGEVTTVDYLEKLRQRPDGSWGLATLQPLPLPPSCRDDYKAVQANDARSGWLNPYLVT